MLQKRTSESLRYTLDCTNLLDPDEIIAVVTTVTAEPLLTAPLVFGDAQINDMPFEYNGRTIAVGKAIQVQISGGSIAAGLSKQRCTIRAKFTSSQSPNAGEGTAYLELNDTPSPP